MTQTLQKTSDTAYRSSRLPVILLAVYAAIAEANLKAHGRWNYSPDATLRWFAFLADLGYSPGDAEGHVLEEARAATTNATTTNSRRPDL